MTRIFDYKYVLLGGIFSVVPKLLMSNIGGSIQNQRFLTHVERVGAMISSVSLDVRRISVGILLWVVVVTSASFSAGFLIAPSAQQHTRNLQYYTESHHELSLGTQRLRYFNQQKRKRASTMIRGGGRGSDDISDEQVKDWGGAIAGLFGNLRIPASLVAGASLGSAFALPMLDNDGPRFGFAKRMYAFSMVTTLGSMLLVVILSTIAMNDITIRPVRYSKSARDYIEENYYVEWVLVRSHFYYGTLAFVIGSAFRAWISIKCPVFCKGVLGWLGSLSLISLSCLMEKSRDQAGGTSIRRRCAQFLKEIWAKAKSNPIFGAGAILWVTTLTYLIVEIPHIYAYLSQL